MKKVLFVIGLLGSIVQQVDASQKPSPADDLNKAVKALWRSPEMFVTGQAECIIPGVKFASMSSLSPSSISVFLRQKGRKKDHAAVFFSLEETIVSYIPELKNQFNLTKQKTGNGANEVGLWDIEVDYSQINSLFPGYDSKGNVIPDASTLGEYIYTLIDLTAQANKKEKGANVYTAQQLLDGWLKNNISLEQKNFIFNICFANGTRLGHVLRPTWISWFEHHKGKIGGGLAVTFMGLLVWLANYHNK